MPRLSDNGHVGMGIAGIQGSVDGNLIPGSFGPYWLDNQNVVCINNTDVGIALYNPSTGIKVPVDNRAANELAANGNVWAAWLVNYGLYASTGLYLPWAGLLDVGPDGAIGYIVDRQNDISGCNTIEMNGEVWQISPNPIAELQLLGNHQAIWRDFNFNFQTINITQPITLPGAKWHPHAIFIQGEWWVSYFSAFFGLVLHPFNSTVGYLIEPSSNFIFHPDMVSISNDVIRIAWSVTGGEGANDYHVVDTNIITQSRVQLAQLVDIPIIGKPCWLGWFEFNQPPPQFPPGNALVKIRYEESGHIVDSDNSHFASFVGGSTIEEIEATCKNSLSPCVAYWDGRNWPRWPVLKENDWLALQAYCRINETPDEFHINMQNLINSIPPLAYSEVALVCQCYTSNTSLTNDLIGLVPVFATLARDNPHINMLLVFSDQNRATGLNDHPEVRPYWQRLFDGITGEPMPDEEQLPENVFNTLVSIRPNYPTPLLDGGARLLNEVAWIHRNEGWGLERKDGGNNCPQPQTGIPCGCDILRTEFWGYDVLGDAEGAAIPLRANRGPADPNRFISPTPVEPETPVTVYIMEYDKFVHRGDPNGMLIRFDCSSAYPITTIDLELLGDGEPSIPIMFLDEPRRDGRYCRALAFKPVVNGDWVLRVTAKDNQGNTGFADGPILVHVEP